ncbi:MAG: universal stress protein [Bacteroidales bacterium]|nr:universal stress protein [Bacteroidales bacterium]
MPTNNVILIPTDFSEVCNNALDHGVQLAELVGDLKLHLFHVINKDTHAMFREKDDIGQSVKEKLQEIADQYQHVHKVKIDYSYEEGSIFELIHEKADEIGANFIILGTHGKKGLQYLLGSFALKVLVQAKIPTLVVQNKKFTGFRKMLMPVNTFTEARQKVGIATRVAQRFGVTIHLYKERVSNPSDAARIDIITKQIVQEFEKQKVGYSVDTSDEAHDSAKKLVEYAVAKNMDLIIILTEPQIGSTYFTLGPWNEKIMFNEAQIPVLCINPIQHGQIFFDF